MASENDENVTGDEAPKRRMGGLSALVMPILLGLTLIVAVAGVVIANQSAKSLRAEIAVMKKEIKALKEAGPPEPPLPAADNTANLEAALKDMKQEVETLAKHINLLTASVAAHTGPDALPDAKNALSPAGESPAGVSKKGTAAGTTLPGKTAAEASSGGAQKFDVKNCDLIGKSPEEQAAILKRCVSLIEPPSEKGAAAK